VQTLQSIPQHQLSAHSWTAERCWMHSSTRWTLAWKAVRTGK